MGASSPPGPRVTLVIPTFNEEESLGAVLAETPRDWVHRIIVADGGSTDRTAEIARRHGAEVLVTGRGYGRACLAAAEAADPDDVLVYIDGDGADDPAQIGRIAGPVLDGAAPGSMAWHQRLAGRVLGFGVGALYGVGYTDMCAFRAIRRADLLALGMTELTYGWNLEMQMRAARARLRVLELPVDNRLRIGGESKVAGTLEGSLKAGSRILATFARIALAAGPRRAAEAA